MKKAVKSCIVLLVSVPSMVVLDHCRGNWDINNSHDWKNGADI